MSNEHDFDDFVVSRTAALSRTAYLLTGDAHLAEDLVQTALLKAAGRWHRIHGDPEPYVRRILYTQNISWWRRRRHVREQALGSFDVPARPSHDPDLRLTLADALDGLTTRQRTVLVLRFYEDLTEAQVAGQLGITRGSVKSIASTALGNLRRRSPELAELVGRTA